MKIDIKLIECFRVYGIYLEQLISALLNANWHQRFGEDFFQKFFSKFLFFIFCVTSVNEIAKVCLVFVACRCSVLYH